MLLTKFILQHNASQSNCKQTIIKINHPSPFGFCSIIKLLKNDEYSIYDFLFIYLTTINLPYFLI